MKIVGITGKLIEIKMDAVETFDLYLVDFLLMQECQPVPILNSLINFSSQDPYEKIWTVFEEIKFDLVALPNDNVHSKIEKNIISYCIKNNIPIYKWPGQQNINNYKEVAILKGIIEK